MAVKKLTKKPAARRHSATKKKAAKKVARRGPMANTQRATASLSAGTAGYDFGAPLLAMPPGPVYPPRDYEECATLVVTAWEEMEEHLPALALTPETMEEMLTHAATLQATEERLTRLLAKAGAARVAYDDKVWRACLKINELAKTLADDNPEVTERFSFLTEYVKARAGKGNAKQPPVTVVEPE